MFNAPDRGTDDQRHRRGSGCFMMSPQEEIMNALSHGEAMSKQSLIRMTGRHHLPMTRALQDLVATGHVQYRDEEATFRLLTDITVLDRLILCAAKYSAANLSRDEIISICAASQNQSVKVIAMSICRLVRFGYLEEADSLPGEPHWLKRYRFLHDKPPVRNKQNVLAALQAVRASENASHELSGQETTPRKVRAPRASKQQRFAQTYETLLPSLVDDIRARKEEVEKTDYHKPPPSGMFASLLKYLHNHRQAYSLLRDTSDAEIKQAEEKFNHMFTGKDIVERTVRKYRRLFEEAQDEFGNGLVGLLPKIKHRGNRNPRLPADVIALINATVTMALTNRWERKVAYAHFVETCVAEKLNPPSANAFGERYKRAMTVNGVDWKKLRVPSFRSEKAQIPTPTLDCLPELTADLEVACLTGRAPIEFTPEELIEAVGKFRQMLLGQKSELCDRTIRKYRSSFVSATIKFGNGLIGLLPRTRNQGNRKDRLPADVLELTNTVISTARQQCWTKAFAYTNLLYQCGLQGLRPPSHPTFSARFDKAFPGKAQRRITSAIGTRAIRSGLIQP